MYGLFHDFFGIILFSVYFSSLRDALWHLGRWALMESWVGRARYQLNLNLIRSSLKNPTRLKKFAIVGSDFIYLP